jgi:hypothetical protein
VQGVYKALGLASTSVFRQQEHVYKRTASDPAWDNTTAKPLGPRDPMLETRKRSIRTILAASRSGRGVNIRTRSHLGWETNDPGFVPVVYAGPMSRGRR